MVLNGNAYKFLPSNINRRVRIQKVSFIKVFRNKNLYFHFIKYFMCFDRQIQRTMSVLKGLFHNLESSRDYYSSQLTIVSRQAFTRTILVILLRFDATERKNSVNAEKFKTRVWSYTLMYRSSTSEQKSFPFPCFVKHDQAFQSPKITLTLLYCVVILFCLFYG